MGIILNVSITAHIIKTVCVNVLLLIILSMLNIVFVDKSDKNETPKFGGR